jgi:hypothetical protein
MIKKLSVVLVVCALLVIGLYLGFSGPDSLKKMQPSAKEISIFTEHSNQPKLLQDVQFISKTETPPAEPGSKSGEVKSLISDGRPDALFKAWSILAICNDRKKDEYDARSNAVNGPPEWMRERAILLASGKISSTTQEACGNLTSFQVAGRLEYLEKAAAAGVPYSVLGLIREGPWGDKTALYTRWQDPAVQEWLGRMLTLLKTTASKGDIDALDVLIDQYRQGGGLVRTPNAATALTFATAYGIVYKDKFGRPVSAYRQRAFNELENQLSPEEVAKAKAAGVAFIGDAK